MPCAKFERRLQALLDRRVAPETDAELVAHAESCESCGAILRFQRELLAVLNDAADEEPTADFSHRVLDQVEIHQRRTRKRRWIALALATAAALLIAVLPFAGHSPELAKRRSKPNRKVVGLTAVPARPALQDIEPENAEELRILIRRVFDEISEHRDEALEPVDHVAGSFRPLTVTLNAAFDALRQTFPGQRPDDSKLPQALLGPQRKPVS